MKCMKGKPCETADAQEKQMAETGGKFLLVYALHNDNMQAHRQLVAFCEKHEFADCVAQSTKLGGGCVKCKRSLKKDFAEIAACFDKTRPGEYIALYQAGKNGIEPLAMHKADTEQ